MRTLLVALFAVALAFPAGAKARRAKHPVDPRLQGLGRSCHRHADCSNRAQRCLRQSDANGKLLHAGFCVLPCASYEAGIPKGKGQLDPKQAKRELKQQPRPRCPRPLQCRSAGGGVPIDICVRE